MFGAVVSLLLTPNYTNNQELLQNSRTPSWHQQDESDSSKLINNHRVMKPDILLSGNTIDDVIYALFHRKRPGDNQEEFGEHLIRTDPMLTGSARSTWMKGPQNSIRPAWNARGEKYSANGLNLVGSRRNLLYYICQKSLMQQLKVWKAAVWWQTSNWLFPWHHITFKTKDLITTGWELQQEGWTGIVTGFVMFVNLAMNMPSVVSPLTSPLFTGVKGNLIT